MLEKIKNLLRKSVHNSVSFLDFVGDFPTQKLLILAILVLVILLILAMSACTLGWIF